MENLKQCAQHEHAAQLKFIEWFERFQQQPIKVKFL